MLSTYLDKEQQLFIFHIPLQADYMGCLLIILPRQTEENPL